MTLLLAVVLALTSTFRFGSYDQGLPRTGQWRHGFAVADMNNDGRPDLAFSSPRKQPGPPVIYLNQGDGTWRRWEGTQFPNLPFDYGAVAAADFDGNGANDLAVASHYRGVTVVLGDGRGTFTLSQDGMNFPTSPSVSAPFSSRAIVAADWNGDTLPDVAALSDGPRPATTGEQLGVTVFQNQGVSWKPLRATQPDNVYGDAIAAGDIDGDGRDDLVTASSVVNFRRVLRQGGDAELLGREITTSLPVSFVRAVDVHDFDGNGLAEIVLAYNSATDPSRPVIDIGGRQLWSQAERSVVAIAAGDINGDGAADVVAALSDGRLLTFRGDGHGFATQDSEIALPDWRRGCTPYAVRVADLSGDGRDEIVATYAGESGCASGGGIEVWRTVEPKRRSVRR